MKRAPLAAPAMTMLSLVVLTACGGAADSDAVADKPKASVSSTPQVSPAVRIAKLMVTDADVDGFTVRKPTTEFVFAKSRDEVTVNKQACASLAYAMNQLPLGDPQAVLTRVAGAKESGDFDGFTYITLAAYGSDGAKKAMADVSKAVKACAGGFTAKASGGTTTYGSVTSEQVTAAGDESLGFKATMSFRGATHTMHTEVVRSADVIGVYFSVNGIAIANARPSDAKLPAPVVAAQSAKLR
ncbi:hypothetical protein ABZ915_36190 [Streptomyces sp. NPDC046915]|uniref:hypothetical protein n=1 Tax=Streptomyces sp. NPDC046915 TaxID=3155257 RepID=UPI0033E09D01